MAVRVVELRGQNFNGGVPVKQYLFRDLATSLEVDTRLQTFADVALEFGGLPIDLSGRTIQELGGNEWYVSIPYSARAGNIIQPGAGAATSKAPEHGGDNGANEPVSRNISISVRGGTQKITQSIRTLQSTAVGGLEARNFGQAIGVTEKNGEQTAEGVDVLSGELSWSLTAQIPAVAFTGAYLAIIENLCCSPKHRRCCKNLSPFFGYQAGEVLISGVDISEVESSGYRKMKFDFLVKRNRVAVVLSTDPFLELTSYTEGDETFDVGGWSYIWVTYKGGEQNLAGNNLPRLLPREAYEEEVYEAGDFAPLKLEEYRVPAT